MIIMIDNYDSFTYNLYQYIGEINPNIEVYRNDKITVDEVLAKGPSHIIISPGPKYPKDAGISIELIKKVAETDIPLLGVCLGHQSIAEAFGGKTVVANAPYHGKQDTITLDTTCPIFKGMESEITAGRYHSLIVEMATLPPMLKVSAKTGLGDIMGLHSKNIFGIQFHPESILTPSGKQIINNFLNL